MRVVEPDQPLAVRGVQGQRIAQPVRSLRSRLGSHHGELHPVSDLIHEQGLAVKVKQRVQPGGAVRRRHRRKLSIADNERKSCATSSDRRAGPGGCRDLLADIELIQGVGGVHATSWLGKRPRRHASVASRPETAARVDLRRIPVPGRRSRFRSSVARIPRRHRHHQRVVVVDALPVPVCCRGLAVDGEPERIALDDDGVGRRGRLPPRGSDGQPVRIGEPERAVIEALHVEPAFVHQPVMGRAQQDEVVEGGLPAVGPVRDVMAVQAMGGGAAGKAASAVSVRERASYRRRDAAGAAPDVEGLAVGAIHDGDDARIAAQPSGGLRRDGGAVLDFAASCPAVRKHIGPDMHDDFVPVRRKCGLPGLIGRLNPVLDNVDRMYLYATNVAIDDGRRQPVHFKLGEAMRLTDVHGSEWMVRFVEMTGNSSVLEYEPPMPPGREGE